MKNNPSNRKFQRNNDVVAVIEKLPESKYNILIQRAKRKRWFYLGEHKQTDTAFFQALKDGRIDWRPEVYDAWWLL